MFGPGTYLSSEMSLSLTYSPVGYAWNYSTFGSHISIVALCEIIDHPEVRSEFDSSRLFCNFRGYILCFIHLQFWVCCADFHVAVLSNQNNLPCSKFLVSNSSCKRALFTCASHNGTITVKSI